MCDPDDADLASLGNMVNLLIFLAFCCSYLHADFDSEGKIKQAVVSRRPMANFDDYEEEKLAKRQKKFGTRASAASTISTGGKRPISTISRIFDKSKLGPVPSAYSDKKKKTEDERVMDLVKAVSCDRSNVVGYGNLESLPVIANASVSDADDINTWQKVDNTVISY